MKLFKRKQIVVLSLVLMIVVAGYIQYSYKQSAQSALSGKDLGNNGEAVYVDGNSDKAAADSGKTQDKKDIKKESSASQEANKFFEQARTNRDQAVFALEDIIADNKSTKEIKDKALNEKIKIVKQTTQEATLENLIKEKGFEDAVATFGEDGSLNVIVKSESLDTSKVAKIVNVVKNQVKIDMDKIHVSNLY